MKDGIYTELIAPEKVATLDKNTHMALRTPYSLSFVKTPQQYHENAVRLNKGDWDDFIKEIKWL